MQRFYSSMSLINPIVKFHVADKISLTDVEVKITSILSEFCDHYNQTSASPLTLRISGGWVRDKLLGRQSHDIDISINSLTGEQFAAKLHNYISQHHAGVVQGSIHKIDKNPEKSKHLETVSTKLFGQLIDIVNLRNEQYTNSESRIPSIVEFGTPVQDALRRDATLNALFYNLTSHQVEDFTSHGLQDLKAGILKTPLNPENTFLDDPLRALRLLRFAAQFGFKIDPQVLTAIQLEKTKIQLVQKVSKERVGIEVAKILEAKYPLVGLNLINSTGLYSTVFKVETVGFAKDIELLDLIYNDLKSEQRSTLEEDIFQLLDTSSGDLLYQKLFYLAIVFNKVEPVEIQVGNKTQGLIDNVIKDHLRFGKLEADLINRVILNNLKNSEIFFSPTVFEKNSKLAGLVRQVKSKYYWKLSLIINYINNYGTSKAEICSKNYQHIVDENLETVFDEKLLLNGKEIGTALNKKPGPWLTKLNEVIFVWQHDSKIKAPGEKKAACINFIKTDPAVQEIIQ